MSILRKKRISKKNKSAWSKTDINDVETYLEEKRQEERIGTFDKKPNEELFQVDSSSDKTPKSIVSVKQKRKLNAKKPLRSLEVFKNTSKVEDPIVKRNHVRLKKSGRILEEEVCYPRTQRHIQANKDRQRYYDQLDKRFNRRYESKKFTTDIWIENDFRDTIPGLKDDKGWISRELALHVTKNIGKPVVKVHDSIRHRTTKAKRFEPPHPGMSYNPTLDDHQKLITTVVEREEKIIKQEKHLKRVTSKMFLKVTPEQRDQLRLKEMRSGLDEDDELTEVKDTTEELKADTNSASAQLNIINASVENKKKSKQKRRKELQQKALQKKHEAKNALKKQIADLNRIKSIKSEVNAELMRLKALRKHRKQVAMKKKLEPKRLSRVKYTEPEVDVNLPQDIPGNLRNLKTESSLLADRFKSFQKRNILPASAAAGKRKRSKVKRFVRSSHKEPEISFQTLKEKRQKANLEFKNVV